MLLQPAIRHTVAGQGYQVAELTIRGLATPQSIITKMQPRGNFRAGLTENCQDRASPSFDNAEHLFYHTPMSSPRGAAPGATVTAVHSGNRRRAGE